MTNFYCTADQIGIETGGGVVTKNEVLALDKLGETVAISCNAANAKGHAFAADDMADGLLLDLCARYKFKIAHFYAGTFTKTVRKLRSEGTKVFYTAAAHSLKLSQEEYAKLGIPYAYPHITDPEQWKQYVAGYVESDVVVCPSTGSAETMKEFGCKNVVVIPHGIDLPKVVKPLPKTFTVGYLGQVGPDKGIIYLLQAWKKLNLKDACLAMAGRNVLQITDMIRQHGGGNIQLLGFVKSPSDLYNISSIYVQPSVTEGFGIEILEAMAHGRPAIASEGAGAVDAVIRGTTGFATPIRNVDEIADRIQYLYKNPDRVAEMGAAGKVHVEQEYQWPTIHAKYVEVWNR